MTHTFQLHCLNLDSNPKRYSYFVHAYHTMTLDAMSVRELGIYAVLHLADLTTNTPM